jgi:hypothetical protein
VYGWIWRRLPFGTPGRIGGSVLLSIATAALLWYVVFPAVDPYLPFNDGQVTTQDGQPAQDNIAPASPSPTNPAPTRSATR